MYIRICLLLLQLLKHFDMSEASYYVLPFKDSIFPRVNPDCTKFIWERTCRIWRMQNNMQLLRLLTT
ncbi:hypothetical protein MANES_18G117266v8 [Manihot esculenta]|uniref:Uncharacterized protein n=1 Tax=Manihot esculenta TaxID=3983 RepID=A0ACB7G0X5_MANES|nr:hypothetical protein MANES_18G117266v8 [Manihot esculenta]